MTSTPDPDGAPDPFAMRRRVLLVAALAFVLFLVATYVLSSTGAPDVWIIVVVAVLYFGVIRPLMRPVRAATALRRRLAYQAYMEQKGQAS